jgi:hypothetical protein
VQSYNVAERRVLEPGLDKHASPPTIIAISPKAHILVSVSADPPLVMLKYRQGPWEPVVPKISKAAVSVVSFHPRKSHLFLMGFTDGSIALYNTLSMNYRSRYAMKSTAAMEISSFKALHNQVRTEDGESSGITGASFLPGTKITVVSLGIDGKCNVLDFDAKQIVTTWSIKAPGTSLAILTLESTSAQQSLPNKQGPSDSKSAVHTIIAVGRVDGKVCLYDPNGRILQNNLVDQSNGTVIDMEWVPGSKPEAIEDGTNMGTKKDTIIDLSLGRITSRSGSRNQKPVEDQKASEAKGNHKRQTSVTNTPIDSSSPSGNAAGPEDSSTVRHTDIKEGGLQFPTYMDLFSPMKFEVDAPARNTSPRSRPRITSSTFVEHLPPSNPPVLSPTIPHAVINVPPQIIPSDAKRSNVSRGISKRIKHKISPKKVSFNTTNRSKSILGIPAGLLVSQDSRLTHKGSSSSSENAKLLARIRALANDKESEYMKAVKLTVPPHNHNSSKLERSRQLPRSNPDHISSLAVKDNGTVHAGGRRIIRVSTGKMTNRAEIIKERRRPKANFKPEAELWLTDSEPEHSSRNSIASQSARHARKGPKQQAEESSSNDGTYSTRSDTFAEIPSTLYSDSPSTTSSKVTVSPLNISQNRLNQLSPRKPPEQEIEASESTITTRISTSRTTASNDIHESKQRLAPGYAESFEGPVQVDHFLPRRASLSFKKNSQSHGTSASAQAHSDEHEDGDVTPRPGRHECSGCGALTQRVQVLEQEMAQMKLLFLNQMDRSSNDS